MKEEGTFVVDLTDDEILKIVKKFLGMRRWIMAGRFPLLCLTCGKPLAYVGFKFGGENFLFWHCYDCHMKPDFEENERHITFERFKQLLNRLIDARRRRRE